MATVRKIVFRNDEIYHIFNRGVERRPIFTSRREYARAQKLLKFYRHKEIPIRFSQVQLQPEEIKIKMLESLFKSEKLVLILAYCLMPNHFHFLVKQISDNGITKFVANFTNAYTKFFNTKHQRVGPLLQGVFKAEHVETDEQLVHLSRYIHLNPVASGVITEGMLDSYEWSSYPEYISLSSNEITEKDIVLSMFKSVEEYIKFVRDQIGYAKELEKIKHLLVEE